MAVLKKIVKNTGLVTKEKQGQTAEFKRVWTEVKNHAPQCSVKETIKGGQAQSNVTVSNLTSEPVSVSNQAKPVLVSNHTEEVLVSNQTKREINSATVIDPNPLTQTEQPVKVHVVCAGSSFIKLKVGGRDVQARTDSGAEIYILSK